MSNCFLTSTLLLILISLCVYYLMTSHGFIKSLKMHTTTKFYKLARASNDARLKRFMEEAENEGKALVPPFIDFDREYAIAPKYNLSICRIKKSMSTLMSGVACVLYDTDSFMKNNRSILEVWSHRFCADKNEYRRISEVKWQMYEAHKTCTKMVVIRDPISRFISFFANKCIFESKKFPERKQCYNCQGNVTCFLIHQYERFLTHSSGNSRMRPSYEDKHAAPLSWNCEFDRFFNDYKIVKLSVDPAKRKNGIDELLNILNEQNVPKSTMDFIAKSALEGETKHATYDSDAHDIVQKQIETDPIVREYLKRIYFLDFIIFDFDFSLLMGNQTTPKIV